MIEIVAIIAVSEITSINLASTLLGYILYNLNFVSRLFSSIFFYLALLTFYFFSKNKKFIFPIIVGYSITFSINILFTPVKVFYPLLTLNFSLNLPYSLQIKLTLIFLFFLPILIKNKIRLYLFQYENKQILRAFFICLPLVTSFFSFINSLNLNYDFKEVTIDELVMNFTSYDGKNISATGYICSKIRYYQGKKAIYQIFSLCNENFKIEVWKDNSIYTNKLYYGQKVTVYGTFTTKFLNSSGLEIYNVKLVIPRKI